MRAIVILLLLVATAQAQPQSPPNWSRDRGWDLPSVTFHEQRDAAKQRHAENVAEMEREYDAAVQRMDDDFNRTSRWMFGGFVVVSVLMGIGATVAAARRRRQFVVEPYMTAPEFAPVASAAPAGAFDVSVLRIGIDGRASKFVQTELEAITKTYDHTLEEARARSLREVSIMLRRVRDSWVYGGGENQPLRPRQEALAAYMRLLDDAKTRVRRRHESAMAPAGAGTSMILVSLVIASRGELMSITDLATGEDLRRALEAAIHRPGSDLIGFDVVWEPAQAGSTLSSIDLEAVYRTSELHRLQGAVVGKAFCTYCGGPFPAELVSCPHCGAPAREQRAS